MPYSRPLFDATVAEIVRLVRPRSCLDLGAGAGKHGALVRRECPQCRITGIEIERDYIDRFNLRDTYDVILCADIMSLFDNAIEESYELVVMGDVIEHLRKSDGVDLLHFLIYRASFIAIIYPIRFLQGIVGGNRREAHISSWSAADFAWCERTEVIRKAKQELVVLRGYLDHPLTVADLDRRLAQLPS